MPGVIDRNVLNLSITPVTVAATSGVVCVVDLLKYVTKTFTLDNTGSNALTAAKIQTSALDSPSTDPANTTDWEDQDTTTFATLAAGATKSKTFTDDVRRWWRVLATSASGTTVKPHVAGATP